MTVREPVLSTVAIADLRPTQITVGMREVEAKRKRWRETGHVQQRFGEPKVSGGADRKKFGKAFDNSQDECEQVIVQSSSEKRMDSMAEKF